MVYTNSRATMKWWDPHTKILKYCSSTKFDELNNNFGKGWSPGSELMLEKNTSNLPTLKNYLSYHTFIRDDIFEGNVNYHQKELPLESPQNTMNIKTCHASLNNKITAFGIMNLLLEKGQMLGSSALA